MHSLLPARSALSTSLRPSGLAIALVSVFLLTSCSTTPYEPVDVEVRDVHATSSVQGNEQDPLREHANKRSTSSKEAINSNNDALQAARAEYYRLQASEQEDQKAKVEATLSSAEYYVQANQHQRAAELIRSMDELIIGEEHYHRSIIVLAYADYAQGYYQQALTRLEPLLQMSDTPDSSVLDRDHRNDDYPNNVSGLESDAYKRTYIDTAEPLPAIETLSAQQVDALLLSSFCYQALNNHEYAIAALVRREAALFGSARAETTRYIWQVINAIPIEQREVVYQQSENTQVRNRVHQSLTGKIGNITQAPQQFNQWREDTTSESINTVLASEWDIDSPRSVYVLLPMSSRFNKAAQAVKAGIEREHTLNESPYKPILNYYDIGDNPLQISQYYASALRSGADFIIGPIGTTYSNEANNTSNYLSNGNSSSVPMLMLGGDQTLNPGNLRLTMSPEMEGRRVAERAWQDGHLSAGVLLNGSIQSQRTMNGFSQKWLSLGGKLNRTIEYASQQFDHSIELKRLFNIHQSERRHSELSQTLSFKPKFSPYQRGDIDFVFMVADHKIGRILRPQINFFTNSQMPVYATSAVYNGIEDKINNIDLDSTIFPVMPWVVRAGKASPYAGQLNMLHAMGMDAYQLAGSLTKIQPGSNLTINGNTGQLQATSNGEIVYRSAWGKFVNGELQIIDNKGLNLIPLKSDSANKESLSEQVEGLYSKDKNSKGSYNDQNWDSRESRRRTGG